VELGRVGTLGQNDLAQFADASQALHACCAARLRPKPSSEPHVFKVAQEIIKLSDDFKMGFGARRRTSRALKRGETIATDGETVYTVQHPRRWWCSRIRMCGWACAPA
jgi:succinylglutamate desuccinylase